MNTRHLLNGRVFQKSSTFRKDKEYRLSITRISFEKDYGKCICINIGDCSDIINIRELPSTKRWRCLR